MKNILKRDWKFFCVLIISIVAILLMNFYALDISDKLYSKSEEIGYNDYIKDIKEGTIVEQKFTAINENLQRIDISFEPLKDINNVGGITNIKILDENKNLIKEDKITRNFIRENNVYSVKFKKQKLSQGKDYYICIEFENLDAYEKFYSINYNTNIKNEQMKLTVNGEEISGTLNFTQCYKGNTKTYVFTTIIIAFSILVAIISIYIYYKDDIKIEKAFLLVVPIVSIMFLITMPTFRNHDELYHWYKSYELSMGKLTTGLEDGVQGTKMPSGVGEILYDNWMQVDYEEWLEKFQVKLDKDNLVLLDSGTAAVYSFVQYIPQAVGIFITRLFTDSAMLITYGGRIANLIVSTILLYFAIKLIPFGKRILFLVACIPISIEGFSSLSADALTISLSLFYIAYILYISFNDEKKVDIKEKIILTISSIILALCKIVYIPMVGLLLIIPKEKFESKTNQNQKSKIINIILMMGIAILINILWLGFSSRYLANFRDGDAKYQVISILTHPIRYIQTFLYTVNINGDLYIMSMLGNVLGWGELIKVYYIVPYVILALLIFTIISDREVKNKFKLYQKVIITLVILAILALIFTSLYVQWTTLRSECNIRRSRQILYTNIAINCNINR